MFRQTARRENPAVSNDSFNEPASIADAQDRLILLREELGKIRAQLTDVNRKEKMQWNDDTYKDWRHKAVHAQNVKRGQQSRMQQWIQNQRAIRAAITLDTNDPLRLLGNLLYLIDDITSKSPVRFANNQQDLLALVRKIVHENPIEALQ